MEESHDLSNRRTKSLVVLCAVVNFMGGSIFGWTAVGVSTGLGVMIPCLYQLTPVADHSWDIALVSASVNLGAMVGALSGGFIANKIGRKRGMGLGSLISCVVLANMIDHSNYGAYIAVRAITGIGIGMTSSICGSYVGEMAPARHRGALNSLFQVSITLAIFLANLMAYFTLGNDKDGGSDAYCTRNSLEDIETRVMYLFLPGLVLSGVFALLCATPILPESSEWHIDVDHDASIQGILREPKSSENAPGFLDLITYPNRRPFVIAIMGAIALQLTGINAVMFYCSKFLEEAGIEQIMLGTVLIMLWNFVTTLVGLFVADSKFGRRGLLIPCLVLLTFSMLLLSPIDLYVQDNNTRTAVVFALMGLYILGFEAGPGVLFWVLCSELFADNIAQKGFSVVNAFQWGLTLLVTFTFPPLQAALGKWVFYIFGAPGVIVAIFFLFCLPETRGRTNKEIQDDLTHSDWVVWPKTTYEVVEHE
eukprot:PhF_6_TR42176/c0_g1_i1/m.63774/K07299/SLC2A1, GLUT1; MFS transporter, SP family, solute carrier family 2 (facilitated glucose transporter), member 1